jgi:trk system potassium uptake protein TrkH
VHALVLLMFVGGCAGSTGGGIKVVRHLVIARAIRREIEDAAHPERVRPLHVTGRPAAEDAVRGALAFVLLYVLLFALGSAILLVDADLQGLELSPFEAVAASATTIGNIGPGVGFAGPMGSFAPFSDLSSIVMTMEMWVGRLELIPVLVLLTRAYWRR